jgi:hypothetical protein
MLRLVSLLSRHVKRFAGLSGYGAANGRLNPIIETRRGERRR